MRARRPGRWSTGCARRASRGVTAHIHPDNAPSQGVARALGLAPTTTVVDGEVRWEAR